MNLVIKRCRMEGFIFFDYAASFPEMYKQMFEMKASGKLKIENDIRKGLENAGEALKELFEGKNKGKMMVQVA
jgi:NADPH-dependent curcumin reductase CurA